MIEMLEKFRSLLKSDGATAPDGYTMAELWESLGLAKSDEAREKLRRGIQDALLAGIIEPCTVSRRNIHGRTYHTRGFRFCPHAGSRGRAGE